MRGKTDYADNELLIQFEEPSRSSLLSSMPLLLEGQDGPQSPQRIALIRILAIFLVGF